MKWTKNILLFVGAASLSASFFGLVSGDTFKDHLLGLVCGASLIYGYLELRKNEIKNC